MSQYRDLNQSATKKTNTVSKKMQELIEREKESYKKPLCEFCETTYNESKTEECHQCLCMREGRNRPDMQTLREQIKESDDDWNEKTNLRTVGLTEREEIIDGCEYTVTIVWEWNPKTKEWEREE